MGRFGINGDGGAGVGATALLAPALLLTLALVLISFAVPPAGAVATGPGAGAAGRGGPLLGVVTQGDSIAGGDVRRMRRAGVDSVRFVVPWGRIEVDPGQYRWELIDRRLRAASKAGTKVTATVYGAPSRFGYPGPPPTASPAELAAWLRFVTALVERYGPGGEFSGAQPGVHPIRRWQIWNEPNLTAFWGERDPSPTDYVRLLDASASAIRSSDPGATVISAGLSPAARGIDPLEFLGAMYDEWKELGAKPSFDELALHPYAQTVKATRRAVHGAVALAKRRTGRVPPITIAEIAWGSGGRPGYPLAGTRRSQARKLERSYDLFRRKARAWHLASVYWYSLRDLPADVAGCGFCDFTGLLNRRGNPKPAWNQFRKQLRRWGRQ